MPFPVSLSRLVYHSRAIMPFTAAALDALLRKARLKNQQHSLSGLLLYTEGEFMQVLEGPQLAVEQLYAVIQADPRHEAVCTLSLESIERRAFPDWRMGYLPVDPETLKQATGFLPLAHTPGLAAHPPTELWELLRGFARGQVVDG